MMRLLVEDMLGCSMQGDELEANAGKGTTACNKDNKDMTEGAQVARRFLKGQMSSWLE